MAARRAKTKEQLLRDRDRARLFREQMTDEQREKQREYQRISHARNPFRNREYWRSHKRTLVAYKGGRCLRCRYDACPAALDFHHRDASDKLFEVSQLRKTIDERKLEADKCDLLCKNCHYEWHYIECNEGVVYGEWLQPMEAA